MTPRETSWSGGATPEIAPPTRDTLYRLYLTLFLRGRSARGLQKEKAPGSIGRKLLGVLAMYTLGGCVAFLLMDQPIFSLSIYLHAMTFAFLGMFLASSAGEVLFNRDETDILLYRPIDPAEMLRAKMRVLISASCWIAAAFNLGGLVVSFYAPDTHWQFIPVHTISTILMAVFCAACVVLTFQLCLRYLGRERLDGLITTAQVVVSGGAVIVSQVLPQFVIRMDLGKSVDAFPWWIMAMPPAWFAGLDDALSGSFAPLSWLLAALALAATAFTAWLAFTRLAADYGAGLQRINEANAPTKGARARRRWIARVVDAPPLRWWLRDPVVRASFVLSTAYLLRDRDVKLRIYPSLAPFLAMPIILLMPLRGDDDGGEFSPFIAALVFGYLTVLPAMAVGMLQYSQQWQASDIFRATPSLGPGQICAGARRAVFCVLALPTTLAFALIVWLLTRNIAHVALLLPSLIAMPLFTMLPNLFGSGIPLTTPTEEAKAASNTVVMFIAMFSSFPISGLAAAAWNYGFFHWFIAGQLLLSLGLYVLFQLRLRSMPWPSME